MSMSIQENTQSAGGSGEILDATNIDADGYTVWFICKHKNCPKRMKFNVNILNAN